VAVQLAILVVSVAQVKPKRPLGRSVTPLDVDEKGMRLTHGASRLPNATVLPSGIKEAEEPVGGALFNSTLRIVAGFSPANAMGGAHPTARKKCACPASGHV
jgi:hypothetical protein